MNNPFGEILTLIVVCVLLWITLVCMMFLLLFIPYALIAWLCGLSMWVAALLTFITIMFSRVGR